MNLHEIRKKINMIDFEILKLLNSRMEFALRTKKLKTSITDLNRENEVLAYIRQHSQGLIEPEFCKNLFARIIEESKRLQKEDLPLIGFQGEHGAFSEVAARIFNPTLYYVSCSEVREIFEAVEKGVVHLGIVPIDSTLGGTVSEVNASLISSNLQIIGEVQIPITCSLLTLPETDPKEVRVVYSNRQILSQCQTYLYQNRLEARPYHDEAGAAKMLLTERPEATAAIASRFAAEYYNLKIVEDGIEDKPANYTRFLVLSADSHSSKGNKCSLIFGAEDRAGALFAILKEFADAEINLTRIESFPDRNSPGNYLFSLDFQGSTEDPRVLHVLENVEESARFYRFLGCYPDMNHRSAER